MKKKFFLFLMSALFLFSATSFINVSAKDSVSKFLKAQIDEFSNAFSKETIGVALAKIDFNKYGTQTVRLSENYMLNCRVESTTEKATTPLSSSSSYVILNFRNLSSYFFLGIGFLKSLL